MSTRGRLLCPGCSKVLSLNHLESSFCSVCSRAVCNACFPLTLRKGAVQCHMCNPSAPRPMQEAPPAGNSAAVAAAPLPLRPAPASVVAAQSPTVVARPIAFPQPAPAPAPAVVTNAILVGAAAAAAQNTSAQSPNAAPSPSVSTAASRPHIPPKKSQAPPPPGPQSPVGPKTPAGTGSGGGGSLVAVIDGRQMAYREQGMPLPALGRTIYPQQRISMFTVSGAEEELVVLGVLLEGYELVVRPATGDTSKAKIVRKSQLEFIILHDDGPPPASAASGSGSMSGGLGSGGEAPSAVSSSSSLFGGAQQQDPNRYRSLNQVEVLGQGAQGTVYKCTTATGEEVVSKEMFFPPRDEATFNERVRQVQAMQRLSHPHLIKYLDVVPAKLSSGFKISVVMPYYHESDLASFITKQRRPLDEHRMCSLLLQISLALHYLHGQTPPIAHRDVKPENILMRQQGEQVLLMDLDTCREMSAGAPRGSRTILGTMEYMAPEVQFGNSTVKCDVWSLGVVAFTLAALPEFAMLPLNGQNTVLNAREWTEVLLTDAVTRAIKTNCPTYSERLVGLICKMLRHEDTRRPDSAAVESELRGILEDNLLRGSR